MNLHVDIQIACESEDSPDEQSIQRWVSAAIRDEREDAELSVRIVGEQEGKNLNETYRGASGATNVLSFPFDDKLPKQIPLIGDIVICAPVVAKEAQEQKKPLDAHWAHMIVHGVLHLLGYDHHQEQQAFIMESLETDILQGLGFPPPYNYQ
jgi:probable rRNA maturation factor